MKNYLRICNLKPRFTAIDAAVIAISVILTISAAYFGPKWIWLEAPVFFALLSAWLGCSFLSLQTLIKLEPQDQISEEYISKLIKSWKSAKSINEMVVIFEAADKAGRFEQLLRKLESKRKLFSSDIAILVLKSLASYFKLNHNPSQMSVSIELTLNVINYDLVEQRIKKVIEELVDKSSVEYGNLLLEAAEPNLYGGLLNIYKCNLDQARANLIKRCESELAARDMDVFALFWNSHDAVAFLRRWACGFDSSNEKFTNSKAVSAYVSRMLENTPETATKLLTASTDKSYLKPVCEAGKLKAAIAKIDLSVLSPECKSIAQSYLTPEKTKRAANKSSELVLCG